MLAIRLNLLPPEKKDDLRKVYVLAYVQSMVFVLFLVVAFVAGLLIPVRVMLTGTYADMTRQTSPVQDEYAVSTAEIGAMNSFLSRVEGIQKRLPLWSDALARITALVPPRIVMDNIAIGPDGAVVMNGTATDRDDLLKFQDNLQKAPFLSAVTSPLSNILQKKDVRFELEMKYSPAAAD